MPADAIPLSSSIGTPALRSVRLVGWISLIALALLPTLPRTTAPLHLAGALGAIALCWLYLSRNTPACPTRWLRIGLLLFIASAIFSTVYPAITLSEPLERIRWSIHPLWHTLRAMVAAGLAVTLLRRKEDFASILTILTLLLFLICLWAPAHFFIAHYPWGARLSGTRGYPTRYATMIYLVGFATWMLALTAEWRNAPLPRWTMWSGYAVALVTPLILLRKQLPDYLPARYGFTKTGGTWEFYVLATILAITGCIAWTFLRKPGRARMILPAITLCVLLGNIVFSATRVRLGLFVLVSVLALLLHGVRRRTVLLLLAGCVLLGSLSLLHPKIRAHTMGRLLNTDSMRHRQYVWKGSWGVVKEWFPLGCGYGPDSFEKYWPYHRPDANAYNLRKVVPAADLAMTRHAHNLWLELLAERGIPGVLAFHLVWIAALVFLLRNGKHPAGRMAILLLAGLFLEGCFTYSLQEENEILYWLIAGMGIAAGITSSATATQTEDHPSRENEI